MTVIAEVRKAMNIQSICESMGKYACLIFCDCFLVGIEPIEAIKQFNDLVEKRITKEDCFVNSHTNLIYALSGRRVNYIKSDTPPNDDRLYISNYVYKNSNHFVVCQDGQIVFNSLDDSQCVKYGKPCDYRWIA